MSDEGYWAETMDGERVWCCSPERERCGGSGYMNCYCGGDLCVCGNQGEIECMGCEDCEGDDDDDGCPLCGDPDCFGDCRSDPATPPTEERSES